MVVGVLKESLPENRVSVLPEHIAALKKMKLDVWVEKDAGARAFASDPHYENAGATLAERQEVFTGSDLILSINHLAEGDAEKIRSKVLVGVFQPLYHYPLIQILAQQQISVFSIDMIPRTTRAQGMDVLSSQANIAGYKAVLLAANLFPRYFPMFMTAAGNIPPAKVLILGAGVAGLQAIATARRLGAVVEVFDTRPAVKEEVQSLGARFIEVEGAADAAQAGGYAVVQSEEFQQKQKSRIAESVSKSDVVITTAQIPGKKAPILVTEEMIGTMKEGSVIVDLAAQTGGNTELTRNQETVHYKGVTL
ncbi:MAG: NAD(P) transhydrogenase subunit alpha, partial [Bacteroidota bacterium]|nr:NAD(P) transhydrogenase subunit alpha [Bacteroidota bacterium]